MTRCPIYAEIEQALEETEIKPRGRFDIVELMKFERNETDELKQRWVL